MSHVIVIRCDAPACAETRIVTNSGGGSPTSASAARAILKDDGWSTRRTTAMHDYCPTHTTEKD